MRIAFSFLALFVLATSFVSPPRKAAAADINELEVLKGVFMDRDLQSYMSIQKFRMYPVTVSVGNKSYMLADPASTLKEIAMDSGKQDPAFVVSSFKVVDDQKVRIKITYQDKKLQLTATRLSPCHKWEVKSFLARKAGEMTPEHFSFN